jgi:hypothetical protein
VSTRSRSGPGHLVAAQRADRGARLVEAVGREVVRALDRRDDLGVGVAVAREQPRALELQRQRRQGVREHVVHVAREPAALGQRRRLGVAARDSRSSSTSASASSRRWCTWRSSRMTKNHGVTENSSR